MALPKHFQQQETTRSRSKKQESRIAKDLKGRTTLNSGATFSENDVLTDYCEVEAKTTKFSSYKFDTKDFKKLKKKVAINKLPIMVVDFEKGAGEKIESYAIIEYADLQYLLNLANQEK